jgi:hypothetical protein
MHRTRGLRKQTISGILAADKTAARMTDEMWYRQAKYREIKSAAEHMVLNANIPGWVTKAEEAWNLSRAIATLYHGGVIPFSHARNLAPPFSKWQEGKIWLGMVKDAYRYAPAPFRLPSRETMEDILKGDFRGAMKTASKGEAAWAKDMERMVGTDDWIDAVRHGVEAHPADKPVGILSNIAKGWGIRSFDALKIGRVKLFQLRKAQLKEFDDQSLRMLGNEVNMSTGTMKMSEQTGRTLAAVSFAPKVWVTRRMEAFTPLRYLAKTGRMTQNERSVMNQSLTRWARHVAVAGAILEGNDLFNQYFTKGKQRVNMHDWMNPGTLWRMNIGGHILPISPLVEVIRAPVAAAAVLFLTRRELHGESAYPGAAGEILTREVLNAIHPSIVNLIELITGREVFGVPRHQRRLPFPGLKQLVRGEEPERDAPLSYTEYVTQRSLIPMADFSKEFFSPALTEEGIPKSQADRWIQGLISSALSGFAAEHTFEVSPKASPQKTRQKRPMGTLGGSGRTPGTLH